MPEEAVKLGRKDFQSDQEVRWCPGCGDYSILTAVQLLLPELDVKPENLVFVSGIGCAARFPYYMNVYGLHGIHGRAPAIATGITLARPDLDVWVVTGDGDALSIGGNHLIHSLRRNVNFTMLLFNNQIYGLTKGQYSPTSEVGKVTKSTPFGSIDQPFNPLSLALGAEATFVARTHDMDRKHMTETFRRAHAHQGSSFVEVYQNCNVFNDGAFAAVTVADVGEDRLLVHDEQRQDPSLAFALSRLADAPTVPTPVGVFRDVERPIYEGEVQRQLVGASEQRGPGDLEALIGSGATWEVGG